MRLAPIVTRVRKRLTVRVAKRPGVLRVAGAALVALCLTWCWAFSSPGAGKLVSSADVMSAAPGQQLWASTLPGGCCAVGAVSRAGTTVFVSAPVKSHFETVAYSAATGARLWAKAYRSGLFSVPRAITVSPGGARVYVTGTVSARAAPDAGVTVAYDARTGRQLWVSRYLPKASAFVSVIAVSPDGTTLYAAGSGRRSGSKQPQVAVISYVAATGKQRWVRYYASAKPGRVMSAAVGPDGRTVYATAAVGSSALTVAYRAAGTLKWAARYNSPHGGFADGYHIVAGAGGGAVYVGVRESAAASGRIDIATIAYRAATGKRMWRAELRGGAPDIAVTPDGRKVIVDGPRNAGQIAIASYNASTGATRWTRLAPGQDLAASGLAISPDGDTMFIGGSRTVAYSVADGTVRWMTDTAHGSSVIGLGGGGARLFGIRSGRAGIATVAYQA